MKASLIKYLYLTLGSFFVVLGLVGIFVPVLPTAPFMLLAAFFYVRSSDRMYNWLINHRLFGESIKSYLEHRAMRKSAKVKAVASIWISLTLSALLVQKAHVALILAVVGISLTVYLLSIRTLVPEEGL
jgi:uncharacterized membrane protein YbaN (DUF454 family)